jgi:omega-hydroxy-beta-dihydromenaquinone-9 sulfotransferase
MHSYILTGIRTGPLMKLLQRQGFTPSPRNIGRLLFILQNAFWSSLLTWRENKVYGEKLKSFAVPVDPVFIIGHWRTGSTFLHQVLALDEQFIAPTLFQAAFPESFLAAERYFRPVMGALLSKRPMDNVRLGFDDAQEDEFALVKLTLDSPLLNVVFPEKPGYFINDFQDFNPVMENKEMWKRQIKAFYSKIRRDSGRTLLLKNPAHSLRIPFLCETFPGARFIHIHRHPYKVVASSLHLWKVMARDNQLKGSPYAPDLREVTEGLIKFCSVIGRDLAVLPDERHCEVSYEALEADPVAAVKGIYKALGLEFSGIFESSIRSYAEKVSDFKKNSYNFDDAQKARVYQLMKKQFEQYHYTT